MRIGTAALVTSIALVSVGEHVQAQDVVPAHVHIRHLADSFRGTPDQLGLLPTAAAEADVAVQHAALAGNDPTDLEAIQRHVRHVVHALDPEEEENGPGHGYGMIRAANRAAHYADLATKSEGASSGIETHGVHVATAARSAAAAAEAVVELADEIDDAEEAEAAAELLTQLVAQLDAVVNGVDADGDGRVGWQEGEGGLAQATRHLELLKQGEGIGG